VDSIRKFIAMPRQRNTVLISTDGINYTYSKELPSELSAGGSLTFNSVCYANGMFLAVGQIEKESGGGDYGRAAYSTGGINWFKAELPYADTEETKFLTWGSICYGNGKFVTVNTSNMTDYTK
jgi:hypothetical protein